MRTDVNGGLLANDLWRKRVELGDIHIDLRLLGIALVFAGKLVRVDLVRQLLSGARQSESPLCLNILSRESLLCSSSVQQSPPFLVLFDVVGFSETSLSFPDIRTFGALLLSVSVIALSLLLHALETARF